MGLDNPLHIAFLLVLLLLVFGAKRLPEMGRSLGAGMRGFKDTLSGVSSEPSLTVPQPEPLQIPAASAAQTPAAAPAGERLPPAA
jgi:sec-independent protein translocase protein TatA